MQDQGQEPPDEALPPPPSKQPLLTVACLWMSELLHTNSSRSLRCHHQVNRSCLPGPEPVRLCHPQQGGKPKTSCSPAQHSTVQSMQQAAVPPPATVQQLPLEALSAFTSAHLPCRSGHKAPVSAFQSGLTLLACSSRGWSNLRLNSLHRAFSTTVHVCLQAGAALVTAK